MTANQVFEKLITGMAIVNEDIHYPITMELVHEIDDETMCEGYMIRISPSFLEKQGFNFGKMCDEDKRMWSELFMEVKYENWHPSELMFYDNPTSHTKLFSCRINDDLRNPFVLEHFDVEKPDDLIKWFNFIIIEGLKALMDMAVYGLVMNM